MINKTQRVFQLTILILIITFGGYPEVQAQPVNGEFAPAISLTDPPVRKVGEYFGIFAGDIALQSNTLIIDSTDSLLLLDVRDKNRPAMAGEYGKGRRFISMQLYKDFVFVVEASKGVYIIDVKNPLAPVEIGRLVAGDFNQLQVDTDRLYITDGERILIYSLANPQSPLFVGVYSGTDGDLTINVLYAKANLLYIYGGYTSGSIKGIVWEIVDVSRPELPSRLSFTRGGGGLMQAYSTSYVYVTTGDRFGSQINVVDIRDPMRPQFMNDFLRKTSITAMLLQNNLLMIGSSDERETSYQLSFFNTSDPSKPTPSSRYNNAPLTDNPYQFLLKDGYLYVSEPFRGIEIFAVRPPNYSRFIFLPVVHFDV